MGKNSDNDDYDHDSDVVAATSFIKKYFFHMRVGTVCAAIRTLIFLFSSFLFFIRKYEQ